MKSFLFPLILIFSSLAYSQDYKGVHYITLLPILSDLNNSQNKEIEVLVEDLLEKDKVIQYKKHDGLKATLNKYGANLDEALYSDKVLQVISNKLLVGSLIRVDVRKFLLGYKVKMDIVSPKGDVLISRDKIIYKDSAVLVSNIIVFWVQQFLKQIPFDAVIVDVDEDEVLVDYPTPEDELFFNKQFVVIRKANYSKISENIKENEYREIAFGVVTEIRDDFFMGKILEKKENITLVEGDKIIFKVFDEAIAAKNSNYKYRRHDLGNYRENGRAAIFGSLLKLAGEGGDDVDLTGATFEINFFLPNSTIFMLDLTRRIGGGGSGSESSLNDNSYRAMFGYSFSPKSLQYVSYADMYIGYGLDTLAAGELNVRGIQGNISFSGPLAGLRLEHPFYKNLSALTQFELSMFSTFKESKKVLGDAEKAYSYSLSAGMRYLIPKTGFSMETLFKTKKSVADIADSDTEVIIQSTQIMFGCSYYY